MSIDELLLRLEKATGPDLDLDHAIAAVIKPEDGHGVLLYTSSIDAALTLVPEGYRWAVGVTDGEPMFYGRIRHPSEGNDPISKWLAVGISPAIALCIAALKARTLGEREGLGARDTDTGASATP